MSIATIVWLIAAIVLGVVEAATVNMVSIWFCLGAAAALITSTLTDSYIIQGIVFIVVSAAALVLTRPLKERISKKHVATNADSNIGRTVTVIAAATATAPARVRLGGVDWNARCDNTLCVGDECIITAIEGNTLCLISAKVQA